MDPHGPTHEADAAHLATFGYRQELRRVLGLFENFAVAFAYLSPVVGIYSLFVLGFGTAGPRYLWLMPVVVIGQLFVALVFAELGSNFPIAGALFQWAKNLRGPGYAWWVGWFYGWALIITVASVATGVVGYLCAALNDLVGTSFDPTNPNTILGFTLVMIGLQTLFNLLGVRLVGLISRYGVYVEILGTFGIAIALAVSGFHHGFGYLFETGGFESVASNPLGVDFGGNWLTGAALVAILAHVYIFYGFESAGDVAEEVIDAGNKVPRAIIRTILIGGLTSFVLVAALILAIPQGQEALAGSFAGGVPFILTDMPAILQKLALLVVIFCFFSCGTAIQAAAARLTYSYARDGGLPASAWLSKVSAKHGTPSNALWVAAIIPTLFSLLVRFTPAEDVKILFFTYPANVNALFILVSFGVSGIYLSFQMVVWAALRARMKGWTPSGKWTLGKWGMPVTVAALVWGVLMLLNIIWPSGLTSPRGALFNFDWMTIGVMLLIAIVGGIYYAVSKPAERIAQRMKR
jgi:amino acid transporter